ncbi:MAG: hypothetical protein AAFY72_13030 [Cyanobacteria bacterium J06649_4]
MQQCPLSVDQPLQLASLAQTYSARNLGARFLVKLMVEWLFLLVRSLASGGMSDLPSEGLRHRIFEPLMAINGPLSQSIGQVIDTGPGRGIALFCLLMGGTILGLTLWVSKDDDLHQLGQQASL